MMRLSTTLVLAMALVFAGCGDDADKPADEGTHGGSTPHTHADNIGKHHGMLADFSGGEAKGQLELKLHDDKGDLELWLMDGEGKPFDLPLDAVIGVAFDNGKKVELRVRNKDKNEDEAENPNNRDGMTNYFIFPGDTGADATWLQGKAFKANVTVSFENKGTKYTTASFELTPHVH